MVWAGHFDGGSCAPHR